MLRTRYKLIVDYPGFPTGEIIENVSENFYYTGVSNEAFWIDSRVVERDPSQFELQSIYSVDDQGVETPLYIKG